MLLHCVTVSLKSKVVKRFTVILFDYLLESWRLSQFKCATKNPVVQGVFTFFIIPFHLRRSYRISLKSWACPSFPSTHRKADRSTWSLRSPGVNWSRSWIDLLGKLHGIILRFWLCSDVIGKGSSDVFLDISCIIKLDNVGYTLGIVWNCTLSIKDVPRNIKKHLFHHDCTQIL